MTATVKDNLKTAIVYSIQFAKILIEQKKTVLMGENLAQIIRDVYLFVKGSMPRESLAGCCEEIGIPLSPVQKQFLVELDKSLRDEEDYYSFAGSIDLSIVSGILYGLESLI